MTYSTMELFTSGPPEQFVEDKIPEIKAPIPDTTRPTKIPPVRDPTLIYRQGRNTGRGAFNPCEYDIAETGRIQDVDSYVRQAFGKKTALMFKEGWDIVGSNPRTIRYLKTRFAQIAKASKVPTKGLMRNIGSSLISKSNAFLIKVRKTQASGGRTRKEPGSKVVLQPVAAYFVAPAETMEYQLNGNRIVRWRQKMPSGEFREYSPEDVVHFSHDRKEGFVFGTPLLVPIKDDIRALRKIEENVELLVYQHLFPLFHYKVGSPELPAGLTETGEKEIDIIKEAIQYMPSEGGIVTPDRHEIKAIGAEGRALRAESYLEHFKRRVISGLGVSLVDLGEPDTSNRSTADNMSRNLIDSVKDYQQVMETFFNDFIINELLLESTFGDSVLDEENICHLKFKEIDIDSQIKKENHYADQFTKDVVTHDEARKSAGREPWMIPTPEEIDNQQDTADKFPEWHRSRWKLFKMPELLIQALDEPYSVLSKAIARDASIDTTEADIEEAGEKQKEKELALEKEKNKGKVEPKTSAKYARPSKPKKVTKDGYLASTYSQLTQDVIHQIIFEQKLDHDWTAQIIRAELDTTIRRLIADQIVAFRHGYTTIRFPGEVPFVEVVARARSKFTSRAEYYITRLTNHVVRALKRKVSADEPVEIVEQTRAVFSSLRYRTDFIEDVEIRKAFNWGRVQAWKDLDIIQAQGISVGETCDACLARNAKPITLAHLVLDDIPPYHSSCNCLLVYEQPSAEVQDKAGELPPPGPGTFLGRDPADKPLLGTSNVASCPKCGKTAIESKEAPEWFHCRACSHKFQKKKESKNTEEELTDKEKMERCVLKIKAQLRKDHPDWGEDRVKSSTWAICVGQLKGK